MSTVSEFDIILDNSQQNLSEVPVKILTMPYLRMLYLEGNYIEQLPEDFFPQLQQLTWLDLRHNQLIYVPENIANHPHLENLLLSGNKIEVLPNELGLVPNLKVLQIGGNPLFYPSRKIIAQGTSAICAYLHKEYEKIHQTKDSELDAIIQGLDKDDEKITQEESEIAIIDTFSECPIKDVSSGIIVTALSKAKLGDQSITHKMEKQESKISLRSYYNTNKAIKASTTQTSNHDVILQNALKREWIEKLRNLLAEQEKILQQEKNLEALTSWRVEKKLAPVRQVNKDEISEVPYGTYPEYSIMLSREDLNKQLDRIINQTNNQPKKDVQKLINDLVSRLKDMENSYKEERSPRAEVNEAGKQIMLIMDIHKKLLQLQQTI